MSKRSVGRIVLGVASGYIVNGVLVAATEQLLSTRVPRVDATQPLRYFVVDLISQCLYTVVAGYLCCLIARPTQRAALISLIGLGLLVGTVSLVSSWKAEPHWYGIALLAVYPPCVWIGWTLKSRANGQSSSDL